MKIHPPKWADRFLQWYCRTDLLEEIQGDAYELFYRTAKENKREADLYFIWNVIRFFRLKNIRKSKSEFSTKYTIMFKSYLITGIRNAMRHRATSIINMLGLSLGVGVAITVFLFMDFMWTMDGFHANRDNIYQVTSHIRNNNDLENWGDSPLMLGQSLKADNPIVESFARVEMSGGAVRFKETVFSESIWFVDPEFLKVFSFPIAEGGNNLLATKESVVLTKAIAEKYFGGENPIGQAVSIKFSNGVKEEFTVSGVIERPENSGMFPTVLLSMDKFADLKFKNAYDWSYLTDATFVLLKAGHTPLEIAPALTKYKTLQNSSSPEWMIEDFEFIPLRVLSQKSNEIVSAISFGAHPAGVWVLGAIALLLLLLACFNYMNVSVATVATRLKEIGIRKVIGSHRKEIIQQFLTENLVLCVLSLSLGVLLSYLFFLPGFNSLYPFTISFAGAKIKTLLIFFAGLLIFIGAISGAYPSFYISSFQPIHILKGREKFGQRGLFSRVLLTAQFVIAFTTIVASFVFIDNSLYLKNKDWGYDHHQNITVPVANKEQFLSLRDKLVHNGQIGMVSGSAHHIGYQNPLISFGHQAQQFPTVAYKVGFDYLETMNIRLKEGRFFDKNIQSDIEEGVIVNESFVKKMDWKMPLKESVLLDSTKHYVIGVVKDFHYDGFYNPTGPVMFTICREDDFRFLSLRINQGSLIETEAFLKTTWKEIAPDDPYEGFLQNSVFEDFNNDNNANLLLLSFISTAAIVLACLGLFGLVSFNITRRLKEFSVRKVFGANLFHIFRLMNRDYIWIVLIAFSIGAPGGFLLIRTIILHIYPDPQPARLIPFLIAIVMMVITVALTVASQLRRVAKESPTVTLKIE
jgi:putative ABC transport system permease protein